MSDYKNGKWAKKIIDLQKDDGSWGYFHSLSLPTPQQPMTTEQAIGRLRLLGFTKDDAVIKKAISYMHDCLAEKNVMPDRREKQGDWDVFMNLMLATWIRRFTRNDVLANEVAKKWHHIVEVSFSNGKYNPDAYINTLYDIMKPKCGVAKSKQLTRIDTYYPISLLVGEIDESIEKAYFDYIMNSATAYYYGVEGAITRLPNDFSSIVKCCNPLFAIRGLILRISSLVGLLSNATVSTITEIFFVISILLFSLIWYIVNFIFAVIHCEWVQRISQFLGLLIC